MITTHRVGDTPAVPALIVLTLTLVFIGLRLSLFAQALPPSERPDAASLFIVAHREGVDPSRTPPGLIVLPGPGDYDGERFYRLALNPLTTLRTANGITLDHPLYRQQRLLYPLLAWLLSGGGRPRPLPGLLIGINVFALAATAWLGGTYARSIRASAMWGVAPALYPGFVLSLSLDTAEPLEMCLLMGALLLVRRGHVSAATACLTLAVLTRETALAVAGAALLAWLWPHLIRTRHPSGPPYTARFFTVPILAYTAWHVALIHIWGIGALHDARGLIGVPGKGLFLFGRGFLGRSTPLHTLWMAEMLALAVCGVAVLVSLKTSSAELFVKIAWASYAGTALLLTRGTWAGDSAFLRVLAEYAVLGLLILAQAQRRFWAVGVSAAFVTLWLAVAWHLLSTKVPLHHSVFETRRTMPADWRVGMGGRNGRCGTV